MKRSPISRFTKRSGVPSSLYGGVTLLSPRRKSIRETRAFTLIELLVAIAVLALIALVLSQMLSAASQMWLAGQAKVNNFTKGRAMLDLLARDLQTGIYRENLPAFPNGVTAFYTEHPGFASSGSKVRNVSWVQYDLGASTNTVLQRSDLAMDWNAILAFGSNNAPTGAPRRDVAPGVVGFQVLFLQDDGSLSTNYSPTKRPRACAIGLAVIDDKTLERLQSDPAKISALRNGFASCAVTGSVKMAWENYLTNIDWKAYPKSLATGLKVFERYVSLPQN